MTSTTFFIIFIPILAILLLTINLILAQHNPYQEKDSAFECGFHSFLGQNRTQFSVSFFIFALLFLLFDLEILLVYPYSVSSYTNDIYGLVIMMVFFVLLTLGFIFELGKNALSIDSRQTYSYSNGDTATPHVFITEPYQLLLSSLFCLFSKKKSFLFNGKKTIKNRVSLSTYNSESNKDITFYVALYENDNLLLVPVVSKDNVTFESDLTKPIHKSNPIPNNEKDSNMAIEKAISIFKNSDLCVCDLKQVS